MTRSRHLVRKTSFIKSTKFCSPRDQCAVAVNQTFPTVTAALSKAATPSATQDERVAPPTFKLFGVSPIWGTVERDMLRHHRKRLMNHASVQFDLVWLPESSAESLGLTITKPDAPRIISLWGDLISGDATSDPSLLSFESFQARRIPLNLYGGVPKQIVLKPLQKLMIDAPSEFTSLYWGRGSEFAAAGAQILPGAHIVDFIDRNTGEPFTLVNAGQTTKADFFTPDTCVAYAPLMVPEMRREFTALAHYWDVVLNRGRFKFSDEWLSEDLVKSRILQLKPNACCVNGRYNMHDLFDLEDGFKLIAEIRQRNVGTVTTTTKHDRLPPPTFKLFGVSPIWGQMHRELLKHHMREQQRFGRINNAPTDSVWIPESSAECLGLTITKRDTPRLISPWGPLISADATSDPCLLSFEAFRARRIPLTLRGGVFQPEVLRNLQKLMIDAPSEFPSLYWGNASEVAAAGAKVLPGAQAVAFVDPCSGKSFGLVNAGQTTKPDFFTPDTCVAYCPFMVPEIRYEFTALAHYWDVVLNRGRFKFSDEWFSEDLVKSRKLQLKTNARCVNGRYNMRDLADFHAAHRVLGEVRCDLK